MYTYEKCSAVQVSCAILAAALSLMHRTLQTPFRLMVTKPARRNAGRPVISRTTAVVPSVSVAVEKIIFYTYVVAKTEHNI